MMVTVKGMDLVSTVQIKDFKGSKGAASKQKWSYETSTLCAISVRNTVVFTSRCSLDAQSAEQEGKTVAGAGESKFASGKLFGGPSSPGLGGHASGGAANSCLYHVYVADMNTPFDVHRVTSRSHRITALCWDNASGHQIMFADESGAMEVWAMKAACLSEWSCVAAASFRSEKFIKARFIHEGRQTYLNLDKLDCNLFKERFQFRQGSDVGSKFLYANKSAGVLVSSTGLVVLLSYNTEDVTDETPATADNGRLMTCSASLGSLRGRLSSSDLTYTKDGDLIVATSNGDPKCPVRMFQLKPDLDLSIAHSELWNQALDLVVEPYPGIFVRTESNNQGKGQDGAEGSRGIGEDECLSINDLKFVRGDDQDSIVIATQHPSGGRVQLWELKESQLSTHKIFMTGDQTPMKQLTVPEWKYSETFNGPPSQVISLETCDTFFQTGRAAACYVTVSYGDGSIQCLLRESLQQIGSVDLPKSLTSRNDEPVMKMQRSSATPCCMAFSANGNVLVAIDPLGQLYIYKMSPVTDPGGSHVPGQIVTLLQYCLVTGYDWWDVSICIQSGDVEAICDRLAEEFHRQLVPNQIYYLTRFMAMKGSLFRLSFAEQACHKAADCYAHLMLNSIHGLFKSILRPAEHSNSESFLDKVSQLLQSRMKEETSIDKLANALEQRSIEFAVEPSLLQFHHNLIQWTTNLACHLMASIPEFKHSRKGPGMTLVNTRRVLNMLREMLLLIRLWGRANPSAKPIYTKTVESYDVIERLFFLITKYKENQQDESIHEECILLPSRVMIPPVNTVIPARGLSLATVALGISKMDYEFGEEPENESLSLLMNNEKGGYASSGFGSHPGGYSDWMGMEGVTQSDYMPIDCIRQMFIGGSHSAVKRCTRCHGTTYHSSGKGKSNNSTWESRWSRRCPCGGPWKVSVCDE